jgi:hypothetical protein
MLRAYTNKNQHTIQALARVYAADRFTLSDDDLRRLVTHSETFFRALPLRFRLAVVLTLAVFRLSSYLTAPRRPFLAKSVPEQSQVYERWFDSDAYFRVLMGQILSISFLGSFYSLPSVLAAIGYHREVPPESSKQTAVQS